MLLCWSTCSLVRFNEIDGEFVSVFFCAFVFFVNRRAQVMIEFM